MATDLKSLTMQTATGDPGAFAELLVALHHDLRAWLATVATHQPMIDTAECEVWFMLRRELLVGVPDGPITLFIHQIAAAVASRLLQSMQNSSRSSGDTLQELMATDGLQRLQAPGVLGNTFAKDVIARVQKLPEDDRAFLQALYVDHLSLHDFATTRHQPLTTIATRSFTLRQGLLDHAASADDEAHDNQLALLIGCYVDRSIIPTDVMNLQNRIDINPIDAAIVAQQIRAHVILLELLDPQSHATVRIIAGELTQSAKLRTRTDSSLIRAVDQANNKIMRIPFTGLPPPPPPPKPEASLTPIFIAAGALVISGIIALLFVWGNPKSSSYLIHTEPTSITIPEINKSKSHSTPTPDHKTASLTDGKTSRFLRGINLGGPDVIINQRSFLSQTEAEMVGFTTKSTPLNENAKSIAAPGLDFDKKSLIDSGVMQRDDGIQLQQKAPDGTYQWWLWVSDPDGLNIKPVTIKTDLGEFPLSTKSVTGMYARLGPFTTVATNGSCSLSLSYC